MSWESMYKSRLVSMEEAVGKIKTNDRIFYSIGDSAPGSLLNSLSHWLPELGHVTFITGIPFGPFDYLSKPQYKDNFTHYSAFLFFADRASVNKESVDPYIFHFSCIKELIKEQAKPDVFMFESPPPDENGYLNFGCYGVYCGDMVAKLASTKIAQVNSKTPYVYGQQNLIHVSEVDYIVENDRDLVVVPMIPITDVETKIAQHIVERIEDGSTIQIGVGGLANAVASFLGSKKDLGIHTEALVGVFIDLIRNGVITGARKSFLPGEVTCSFGPDKEHAFVHKNSMIKYYPIDFINDVNNIAKNDYFVSMNNALMVDLTGQVCAESLGFRQYSGTGGQVDFVRGARLSKKGQSFITLPSINNGKSTITLTLPPGQVITTLRSDVDMVVTEFGIAELKNQTIRERVRRLIKIAHPQFCDELLFEAKRVGLL